jgi:hypothetical protein
MSERQDVRADGRPTGSVVFKGVGLSLADQRERGGSEPDKGQRGQCHP